MNSKAFLLLVGSIFGFILAGGFFLFALFYSLEGINRIDLIIKGGTGFITGIVCLTTFNKLCKENE